MRFTLRDLFWLTVVVALALGWGINSANLFERLRVRGRHAEALRMALYNADRNRQSEESTPNPELPVDWELGTREIPSRNWQPWIALAVLVAPDLLSTPRLCLL